MKWFRMHSDVVDKPKVQRLPPELFKFWVNCLCITSQNDGQLPCIADIAWKLKLTEKKTEEGISALVDAELIDQQNDVLIPHNWAARQYKSDVSTERVRRFRNGNETFPKRFTKQGGDVTVTPPDTDTEQIQKNLSPIGIGASPEPTLFPVEDKRGTAWFDSSFARWYAHYWYKTGKADARRAYEKRIKALVKAGGTHEAAEQFLVSAVIDDRKRFEGTDDWDWRCNLHPATWLNGSRWEDQAAPARASPRFEKPKFDGPEGNDGWAELR